MKKYSFVYSINEVAKMLRVERNEILKVIKKLLVGIECRKLANGSYRFNEITVHQLAHIIGRNRMNEDERLVIFELGLIKSKYSLTLP